MRARRRCTRCSRTFVRISSVLLAALARQRRVRADRRASLRRSAGYRRLRCGARSCGPSPNSLRSLRSAAFRQAATSQSTNALRAGPQALCSSPPQRRPPACPDAPLRRRWSPSVERLPTVLLAAGGTRQGRFLGRRGAERMGRRAQRASITDSRALLERSERSERSEFDRATHARAPQRSRRTRRPPEHESLPGTACREPRRPAQ